MTIFNLTWLAVDSSFGQTVSQPKKVEDSELPDHSITPDSSYQFFGQFISDSIGYHLFSKNLRTGDTIKLSAGNGYYGKVIMSPGGKQLVYEWVIDDKFTEIQIVNIDGSDRRILYEDSIIYSLLQEWSPDGKYVLAMLFNQDRVFKTLLIPVSKEQPIKVLRKQQFGSLNWGFLQCKASFSDNNKFIAYDISTNNSWYARDIYIKSITEGIENVIVRHPANDLLVGWVPGSKGIIFCSDRSGRWALYYLEIKNYKPAGQPVLLVKDIGAPISVIEFTKDGSLFYRKGVHNDFNLSIARLDTVSKKIIQTEKLSSHIGFNSSVQWSKDGQYLAYAWGIGSGYEPLTLAIRSDKTQKEKLIVLKRLMRHGGHGFEPQWSPDGKHLLVTARTKDYYGPGMDSQGLYDIDVNTGNSKPVKLSSSICGLDCYVTPQWINENKIIFQKRSTASIILKNLNTGIESKIYQQADSAIIRTWPTSCMSVSPDGKYVAFVWAHWINGKWINKLLLISLSNNQVEQLYASSNEQQFSVPAWMPDSRNIIFAISKDATNTSFELAAINTRQRVVEKLGLTIDGEVPYSFSVHPDGNRVAFTTGREVYYREETWVLKISLPIRAFNRKQ